MPTQNGWKLCLAVSSANTAQTVRVLRNVFSTHGIPDIIVSDNGSTFTSSESKIFTRQNGIRQLTSAPYHPSTNGLAERAVQTFIQGKRKNGPGDLDTQLAR